MKSLLSAALLLALATPAVAGQNISANVYDSRSALSAQTAELATVVAVRDVQIKNTGSNPGTYIGATVGAAGGYALSRGSSSFTAHMLGGVLGGAMGGAAGQTIGNMSGPHHALQIFVQRYQMNGRPYPQLTSVVEADDQGSFRPGDRVLLVRGRNGLSIVRADVQPEPAQTDVRGPGSYGVGVLP